MPVSYTHLDVYKRQYVSFLRSQNISSSSRNILSVFIGKASLGLYDRTYSARDYSENLATIISNGVLRSTNDDLKVTVNGVTVTVGIGRAWINGCVYHNDNNYVFPAVTVPTGGARYDRVILLSLINILRRGDEDV